MTEQELLLALEAALTACEGVVHSEAFHTLHEEMMTKLAEMPNLKYFGDFLDAQKVAVEKLAKSPVVFGC